MDSLKRRFNEFRGKPSLGAPVSDFCATFSITKTTNGNYGKNDKGCLFQCLSKFPKLLAMTTSAIPVLSEIFQLHAVFEPKDMVPSWCPNHSVLRRLKNQSIL